MRSMRHVIKIIALQGDLICFDLTVAIRMMMFPIEPKMPQNPKKRPIGTNSIGTENIEEVARREYSVGERKLSFY